MVVALASCAEKEELHTDEQHTSMQPIAFSSVTAEQEMVTRAATTLGRVFIVYGYKDVNGEQTVFNGYKVKYEAGSANTSEDNTHGYYYVDGNQTIKYWDLAASEYHFWGVWRQSEAKATFSGDKHNILTIPNVTLKVGEPTPEDDVLFSSLYERRPVTTDVVQLSFKRPYAKLCIQFYTTEPIESESDNVKLTDISFAPDPDASASLAKQVYGKGDVTITYPLTTSCSGGAQEEVSISNTGSPQDALLFKDVVLTQTSGISSNTAVTAPVDDLGKKYYYPLPMGELNPDFILKVKVNGDSESKTAVVPATYMHWKPNYLYTYIFKITEAGKKIEFYDVKIDPWMYGGSLTDEWTNW